MNSPLSSVVCSLRPFRCSRPSASSVNRPRPSRLRWALALLGLASVFAPSGRAEAPLDTIVFGDSSSESAHAFASNLTVAATGPSGTSLNQPYRYAQPKTPLDVNGGDLTFTLAVDPVRRNYVTIKFWGGDDTSIDVGRLYLYVPVAGVNYQVGYRHEGDYMPLSVAGGTPPLPGRVF